MMENQCLCKSALDKKGYSMVIEMSRLFGK